jgi:CRP-like cAMP-binding protein
MIDPVTILGQHPGFALLPADIQKAVAQRAVVRAYEAGALVHLEGEPDRSLYLVASGLVRIFKASEDGKEQDLHHVEPGQSFNEAAALDGEPTLANAQATEPSVLLLVGRESLSELMTEHPQIAWTVARVLAGRLREVSSLAGDLALRHLVARIAGILLHRAERESVVTLPTRQRLAAMVGSVREVATRALRHLEHRGAIRLEPRGKVAILDPTALGRLTRKPGAPVSGPRRAGGLRKSAGGRRPRRPPAGRQ